MNYDKKRYWEDWAKDVADIASAHTTRIETLVNSSDGKHRQEFNDFVESLQDIINPSITEADAIEMLSQHLITRPVFDALFEDYQFTKFNPVSVAMQKMIETLEGERLENETKKLDDFYTSVKMRASKIDNAEGKQKIIIELYDKFFKNAFPKMAERLGIVYTPVEVVDFIVKSVDFALKQEWGYGITAENVHILDPFTGTGTFMVRLLQNGLIEPKDLKRKFTKELHANEIVLLAYYIAAINIEATYHDLAGGKYQPFNGIVLTDTFNQMESQGSLNQLIFPENNKRVKNQKEKDIRVIIGNPPYSAGQKSENDGNKNLKYPQLDDKIRNSYAKYSNATNKNSLYDSYIRAIRWATDRLKDKGIICFVTNGSFLDSNSADGLRKCLADDFTSIYYFNLRGNGRTSGERCRQEGHPLFAALGGKGGSLAPIAITLLIKNPKKQGCQLFYHDIGNYLTRQQKLSTIQEFGDISAIGWEELEPNDSYDWINQRNDIFENFISLGDKKDEQQIFIVYSNGLQTNRDSWAYNFSQLSVLSNMKQMIEFYNQQINEEEISNDPKRISWTRGLKKRLSKKELLNIENKSVKIGIYRPYCKQWLYFSKEFNEYLYKIPIIFPESSIENYAICITGIGVHKDFNCYIVNQLPDVQLQANNLCFPLYTYEMQEGRLFGSNRQENIPDDILSDFRKTYKDEKITKEDIFYYVYGILHSAEYKQRFSSDLKKMLPRIPYAKDFWVFSKAGRNLAYWHLNYETIDPYELTEVSESLVLDAKEYYRVQKMMFGKTGKVLDKTKIIYNSKVTLTDIPLEAYEYIVNGKSALDWIMERYQVTTDKDSGIVNNPNDWSDDPRYIIDLVRRIVRVSLETMKIVNSLPALNELNNS